MKPVTHLLLAVCLLLGRPAQAQTTPMTYEFLTVMEEESGMGNTAKILFAPAFQGKTEVQLAPLGNVSAVKNQATRRQNVELLNQQLEAVTAAGWELVHVSTNGGAHEYLFRRRKP